jgi:hypothetical protein
MLGLDPEHGGMGYLAAKMRTAGLTKRWGGLTRRWNFPGIGLF